MRANKDPFDYQDDSGHPIGQRWSFNILNRVDNSVGSLFLPLMLMVVWLCVFIFELASGAIANHTLNQFPVVMGNVSHISWVHWLVHWLDMLDHQKGGVGLFGHFLIMLQSWLVMILASVLAAFFHLSWAHLLGNMLIFTVVALGLWGIQISGVRMIWVWLKTSFFGIALVWFIAEFLSGVVNLAQMSTNVLTMIGKSEVVIAGASVGIYGMLGFLVGQILRQFKFSFGRNLALLLYVVLSMVLIYTSWTEIGQYNLLKTTGSAVLLSNSMHLMGYVNGFFGGLRYNYAPWSDDIRRRRRR